MIRAVAAMGGALAAAVIAVGCGGEEGRDVATQTAPPAGVALARDYREAAGTARSVAARLAIVAVHPPAQEVPVPLPAGETAQIADVQITDTGRDRFPLNWAAFTARTADGTTLRERFRLPPRRLAEGRQIVPVGFSVAGDDALRSVRVRSIVRVWPFDVTLRR